LAKRGSKEQKTRRVTSSLLTGDKKVVGGNAAVMKVFFVPAANALMGSEAQLRRFAERYVLWIAYSKINTGQCIEAMDLSLGTT
jgi:hypothetical protein